MFSQYDDHEIFDALRRVHLIKEGERPENVEAGANRSVFWNLDVEVAEGVRFFLPSLEPSMRSFVSPWRHSKDNVLTLVRLQGTNLYIPSSPFSADDAATRRKGKED